MDSQGTASQFKTTSWTLILRAASGPRDLEILLQRYRWPVYAYLRRKGYSQPDADDLTQGFLCDVLLERNLLERADQSRGKFRSFLLKSLEHYLIDKNREERGRYATRPKTLVAEDPHVLQHAEPCDEDDPHSAFHRQWAATTFDLALTHVRDECTTNGMARQWTAFDDRVLRPATHGCEPTSVEVLMRRLGVARRSEIDSMLQTIKRKIERALREVVMQTVDEPADADGELHELRRYLGF